MFDTDYEYLRLTTALPRHCTQDTSDAISNGDEAAKSFSLLRTPLMPSGSLQQLDEEREPFMSLKVLSLEELQVSQEADVLGIAEDCGSVEQNLLLSINIHIRDEVIQ